MLLLFKASNLLRNKAVYSQNKYYKKIASLWATVKNDYLEMK